MKTKPGKGNLYTIAAPSGTGKTTLVKTLTETLPGITVSISHTTRAKRPAEQDGINYYFVDDKTFCGMVERNEFLEHATVFNRFYGTSRHFVEETLNKGIDVILEIDWQGCQQIKHLAPDCISIFILPPSMNALAERLLNRNQDNANVIQERLADAKEALRHINEFDYVVINDDFDIAINDLKTIILAGRLLRKRQQIEIA